MSAFPSVRPTSRVWSPGVRAQSVYQSLDGIEIRFVHGSKTTGQRLSLTFDNVTEAVGRSITDHYDTNGTTYGVFGLPAEVFAGMADYNNTNPVGNDWRYVGPPQVTYGSPGYQSVTVELLGVSS